MTPKLMGACLILLTCGAMGFKTAADHRQKERMMQSLITSIHFMSCELQYHMTPLPQLMVSCAKQAGGVVGQVFDRLAMELERQIAPDAACCMQAAVDAIPKLPPMIREKMILLGNSLGRFDLTGQLSGLEMVSVICKRDLDGLLQNRDARLRSYVTLSLCAGVALVIIFL